MLGRLFGRRAVVGVPTGFPVYTYEDFALQFSLSESVARQACKDYCTLLSDRNADPFVAGIRANGRNGFLIGRTCSERYGVPAESIGGLVRYFMDVTTALKNRHAVYDLGITSARWISTRVPPYCHGDLDGIRFNPQVGAKVGDMYLLPGATFGCGCIAKSDIGV